MARNSRSTRTRSDDGNSEGRPAARRGAPRHARGPNTNHARNSGRRGQNGWASAIVRLARERPFAATIVATGAAAAGIFLWSKRTQISNQLTSLSDQIGEWKDPESTNGTTDDSNSRTSTGQHALRSSNSRSRAAADRDDKVAGLASAGAGTMSSRGRGRAPLVAASNE